VSVAAAAPPGRAKRLRAPLLLALWALLAIEGLGGIVIFFARLAAGRTPGESLHVVAGAALVLVYACYQVAHWSRVAPIRGTLDYVLGLISAGAMIAVQVTGLWLGWQWWRARQSGAPAAYSSQVSAAHNVMSMLVLTFVGAHLCAVLMRDARARR
jgi:hypothetical protein